MTDKLPPSVLVVEPDEIKRTSISNNIERYGFTVLRSGGDESVVNVMALNKPNMVIISTKQKELSQELGIKLRKTKGFANIPIIFVVDKIEENNESSTNPQIFNEYLMRNFTPNELMITIKSLLRKSKPSFQDKVIQYKDLKMDLATYKVSRKGRLIHLGPTEFKILQLMVQSPKTIFSRQQIIDYVWGRVHDIEPRTVDVHVNRLRTLLKNSKDELPFIETVRASGYCLSLPGEID